MSNINCGINDTTLCIHVNVKQHISCGPTWKAQYTHYTRTASFHIQFIIHTSPYHSVHQNTYATNTFRGVRVWFHIFLSSALKMVRKKSCFGCFTAAKQPENWAGTRASTDSMKKRIFSPPPRK